MTDTLAPGHYAVPPGMVATVVTHLEMTVKPTLRPAPADAPRVSLLPSVDTAMYRDLFNRVGGQDWLWFSRLRMQDAALSAILNDPDVTIATMFVNGRPEALLELDFRIKGECALGFFGVTAPLVGTGAGRALMNAAIDMAWAGGITRFHVHTCTLDHPNALSFYRRSGFTPIKQQIEISPDPRLSGVLPETAGAHIPIIQ